MAHAPVSVVVPMRDEAGAVVALLEGLSRQKLLPAELIFVDTGSRDGSAARVQAWWSQSGWEGARCSVIAEPGAFPGGGRNAGVRASTQPWIAFIDCGIVPEPGWLDALIACAERKQADAVMGMCRFEAEGAWATAVCALSYGVGTRRPALPASLFRRSLFDRIGHFDPQLRAGEDLLWLDMLARSGAVVETCEDAEVIYGRFPESASLSTRKWFEYERHVSAGGIGGWRRRLAAVAPLLLYPMLAISASAGVALWLVYLVARGVVDPIRRSARRTWWQGRPMALACAPLAAIEMDIARGLGCLAGLASNARESTAREPGPEAGRDLRQALVLWVLFFCFATSAALLFQKVLLPRLPALHAGSGLLDGDSIYFHNVAVLLAARIQESGWGAWSIFPAPGATGNVAILAALYALFGNDPSLIVPINAGMHALSGVLLFLIGRQLLGTQAGRLGGLAAGTLFVAFPSALNWYGQLHKDGYAIAGVLLLVWTWIRLSGARGGSRDFALTVVATLAAIGLIALVRPYNLIPLAGVLALVLAVLVTMHLAGRTMRLGALAACAASLALVAASADFSRKAGVEERYSLDPGQGVVDVGGWKWTQTRWLPGTLDGLLESAAFTRVRFIKSGASVGAGSMIDTDQAPASFAEIVAYAPRALQVGLFAPFPDRWLERRGAAHGVAMLETLLWYLMAPGVVLCLLYAPAARSLTVVGIALLFLVIYGLTSPNVGTLYRIRSPYLFLLITMGCVGWLEFLRRRRPELLARPGAPGVSGERSRNDAGNALPEMHASVLGAGFLVAALTALTFVGLFVRDAILARWYGTGAELDAYFVAIAVPSFLVAVLSIPLGSILAARFLEVRHQESTDAAQALVSRIGGIYAAAMLPIVVVLVFSAGPLLRLVGWDLSPGRLALAQMLLYWMLPILALSGFVIIGNAILNALGAFALPALAQCVVPVISIAAILAAGRQSALVAAVVGMLAGQVLNLWIVARALSRRGISLRPRWSLNASLRGMPGQYAAVVAAALLTNLAAPVNLGMASTLERGAATLGLGTKMVTFVAGLITAAMATVILPRFAAFMARRRLIDMREELSFLLLAGTALTIPIAIVLFVGSESLVRLAFEGGAFGGESVEAVSRVMSYGVIQLPFLTVSLLILKFAIAARAAGWVFVASLIALCLNVALNLALIPASGVAGIALASAMAVALSTFFMLLLFRRLGHVTWMDVLMLTLNWMPYTTFVVCLHYRSYAGAVVSMLAMLVLFAGHLGTLSRGRHAARA